MEVTANDYLKNLKFVESKISDEVVRITLENENKITNLNIVQIENHRGNDNLFLKNDNPRFRGFYSKYTASINPDKIEGTLYDFYQTGDFLRNFFIDFAPSRLQFDINSTGTGSGEKADFFAGYPNLFGLTLENEAVVNWDIIYPELMEFINKYV